MKIALLCGGKFSFPSIQALVFEKYLFALGLGSPDKGMAKLLEDQSQKNGIDFMAFPDKASLNKLPEWIKKNNPDAVFCICFPFQIPKECLDLLPGKFINFHTGPLPQYRGPMPIFEVLKSMESETAIGVHIMNEEFDKGPLILNEIVQIKESETFGSLSLSLSKRTALVANCIAQMLEFGSTIPIEDQSTLSGSRYYPNPKENDTLILWKEMHAEQIIALINACNPYNSGADTMTQQMQFKIVSASVRDEEHAYQPGTIIGLNDAKELQIACIEDQILLVDFLHSDIGFQNAKKFNDSFNLNGQVLLG